MRIQIRFLEFRLGSRSNKPGVDAQFSVEGEKFAYPIRPDLGEVDYPDVFVSPLPAVIAAMRGSGRFLPGARSSTRAEGSAGGRPKPQKVLWAASFRLDHAGIGRATAQRRLLATAERVLAAADKRSREKCQWASTILPVIRSNSDHLHSLHWQAGKESR